MKKEYSIGLFAIAAIVTLIFGYNYLKGNAVFDTSDHFYIRYDEVNQLEVSAKVYVNGFEVGTVIDMNLDPEDADFMIVEIKLAEDISLPKSTIAYLLSEGVFGGKAISLDFDQVCISDCLQPGDFIISGQKGALSSILGDPTELDAYISKIESGLDGTFNAINGRMDTPKSSDKLAITMLALHKTALHIEEVSRRLAEMLDNTSRHLSSTMKNLSDITKSISNNDNHIENSLANIDAITQQLKDADLGSTVKKTNQVMESLDTGLVKFTATLDATKNTLNSLQGLINNINKGEGTLGKLNTDPELYVNLAESLKQLDLLMQDLRLNPKRYINVSIFGKKQKKYTKAEDDPANQ